MATHDYVIDNSTGANVRADINNVLQAILTNNSSSSAPSTTAAYMWWADTTNGVLKIRNSSNNAWVELLQLDGTLTLEDGSASTPALAFRDDLDTGIFSDAADEFNVATGGVERFSCSNAAFVVNQTGADVNFRVEGDTNINLLFVDAGEDRIGVNESTPLAKFHIKSTDASVSAVNSSVNELILENNGSCGMSIFSSTTNQGAIAFGDSDDNDVGKIVYDHSDNSIFFRTAANERMRIDSSGRLLLGTTTQGASTADDLTIATTANTGITIRSGTASNGNIFFADGTSGSSLSEGYIQYDHSGNYIRFGIANTERMRVDSSGRVLIGSGAIATPKVTAHGLDVAANNMSIVFGADSNSGNDTSTRTNNAMKDQRIGAVHYTNAEEPVGVVRVLNQASANDISFGGGSSIFNAATSLRFFTGATNTTSSGSERMRIHSSGEVSIATTSKNLQGGGASDFYLSIQANTGSNHNGIIVGGVASGHGAFTTRPSGTHLYFAGFFLNGSASGVGNIEVGNSGVSFHTTSDYRLKENVTDISDGITRLKELLPRRFNFINDETNTLQDGFLAHEVSSIVPEAISGEKDAVATEDSGMQKKGDPIYQQIDQSKLVPLLVAAVQELITKVETLEAA